MFHSEFVSLEHFELLQCQLEAQMEKELSHSQVAQKSDYMLRVFSRQKSYAEKRKKIANYIQATMHVIINDPYINCRRIHKYVHRMN